MSGRHTRSGSEIFSLVGDGNARAVGRGATRRQVANAALIRHRQKPHPRNVLSASTEVWLKYLAWRLEWENSILRYRDGNNDGKDNDDD